MVRGDNGLVRNGTVHDKNRAEQQHRGAVMDDIWDFLGYITEE